MNGTDRLSQELEMRTGKEVAMVRFRVLMFSKNAGLASLGLLSEAGKRLVAAPLDERRKEWDRAMPHFLSLLQKAPGSLARGVGALHAQTQPPGWSL